MKRADADSNKYLIALGKNIAKQRKEKGYTQKLLSNMVDMDKENLIRIEKGRTNPTTLTLRKLAKVLLIKTQDFFEGLD
ncbi:MAG: helix-turn-helix transcriptional regulator [Bacteroidetes bacterium]|nr:helix-turn-helix transcriptional regulator [Bacteroidota bacterium]